MGHGASCELSDERKETASSLPPSSTFLNGHAMTDGRIERPFDKQRNTSVPVHPNLPNNSPSSIPINSQKHVAYTLPTAIHRQNSRQTKSLFSTERRNRRRQLPLPKACDSLPPPEHERRAFQSTQAFSVPVQTPSRNIASVDEQSDDDEYLEHIYDTRTWNMHDRITRARGRTDNGRELYEAPPTVDSVSDVHSPQATESDDNGDDNDMIFYLDFES